MSAEYLATTLIKVLYMYISKRTCVGKFKAYRQETSKDIQTTYGLK